MGFRVDKEAEATARGKARPVKNTGRRFARGWCALVLDDDGRPDVQAQMEHAAKLGQRYTLAVALLAVGVR